MSLRRLFPQTAFYFIHYKSRTSVYPSEKKSKKKCREAEMWSEQGRENSINTKYFLMCLFARSLKQEDYAHYSICITVSSSQTDAITWDILANWSNWELCTRILMKKWGLCEGGYILGKKKAIFRNWHCSKSSRS